EKLSAANRLLEETLSSINEAVFMISPYSRVIQDCNRTAETIFGYTREELIGRDTSILYASEEDFQEFVRINGPVLAIQKWFAGEFRMRRKNGEVFPTEHFVTHVHNDEGEYVLAVSAVRDITERKRAEEEIGASNRLLENTLSSLNEVVLMVEPYNRRIANCNETVEKIFGYRREELIGRDTSILYVSEEEFLEFAAIGEPVLYSQGYFSGEFRMKRRDGEVFPTEHFISAMYDDDGQYIGVVSVVRDITERKRAEEEREGLLQSLQTVNERLLLANATASELALAAENRASQLEATISSIADGVVIYSPDGAIARINAAGRRIMGYSEEDLRLPKDRRFAGLDVRTEDGRPFPVEELPAMRALRGETVRSVLLGIHRLGETISASTSAAPICDATGRLLGAVLTMTDVTKQKHITEALQESEERFRTIFEGAGIGMVLVDMAGGPEETNPALQQMLGYNKDELRRMVFAEFIDPDVSSREGRLFRDLLEGKLDHFEVERSYERHDGTKVLARLNFSLVSSSAGEPRFLIGMVEDITEKIRAEQNLKQYRFIFENARDIFLLVARDGRILDANDAAVRAYGYTREELTALNIKDLRAVESLPFLPGQLEQAESNGILFETAHRRKDGSTFPVEVSSQGTGIGDTRILFSVIRDINARKQAETDLARIKKAVESTSDGVGITSLSAGTYYVNPAWKNTFGYSSEELSAIGGPKALFVDQQIAGEVTRTIRGGKPWNGRAEMKTKDNRVLTIDLRADCIRDEAGDIIGLMAVHTDVTARKQAEDALRESEERFRLTFGRLPIGAAITSLDYRFQQVNEAMCRFTGYSRAELVTLSFADITHPDDLTESADAVGRLLAGEIDRYHTDKRYIRKDGQVVWGHLSLALMRSEAGDPFCFLPIVEDITERKRRDEEIAYLTFRDRLTGLHNRTYLEQQLEGLDSESHLPLSVVTLDVNGLKLINDAFGRQAGDKVLASISHVLANCAGKNDVVCRWGDDAFVIVLPNTPESVALEVCDWIKESFQTAADWPIPASLAFGTATKASAGQSIEDLLRESEERMYRQKLLDSSSARSSVVASLARTLAERSYETEEHAERLKALALKVGEAVGLSTTELDKLALLAALHDIGKIAIPDNIVMKEGPLTPDEWEIMRQHTEIGYRIAQSTPELSTVAMAILSHHERWDGAGYPRGLKGDQIEIISRITAIVDAYDAMTHARPYKPAISHEEAMAEIQRCAGLQFDPRLVQKFVTTLAAASAR
ncbi:MAG: PAS domain S-box protein, partial [Chloroflexi bacterium]|nr:PAS domain S-box protein [Chloroflexota bacterium]